MQRMDEIWAHKEAVASGVLSDIKEAFSRDIAGIRKDLDSLEQNFNRRITDAVKDIRSDMVLKHKEMEFVDTEHERRLTFVEKIILAVGSVIGLAFLGGLTTLVFK